MRSSGRSHGAWLALVLLASPATADERALLERIEQLERRIRNLESNQEEPAEPAGGADWTRHLRIGGSANAGYFGGEKNSDLDPDSFQVWDARLFVDAELGDRVSLGDQTVLRNAAFTFEWDLVRLGKLSNQVGELFADFQGVGGLDALNFQVGRFQIPVGEAYLRYSQGYADKPFISNTVGGPWWWDEGVRFYGHGDGNRLGYVASVTNGETPFNAETGRGKQGTLRLFARPTSWLYASVSGLYSGRIGSSSSPANGALWLGESWARSFGSGTSVASFQDGVPVADGPNVLRATWLAGADVVADFQDRARAWLAYGRYDIDSTGGTSYDRVLHYWIAELILRGAWLSESLRPFYLGVRGSGLGTYDGNEGYLLDVRRAGSLGYNMESITEVGGVLGWKLARGLRLRAEYTHHQIELVRGVTTAIRDAARHNDFFAVEVGAAF